MDEPTNSLDLPSIEEIVVALKRFRGALVVVSHRTAFIEEISIEKAIEIDRCGAISLTSASAL